ncbi:MAG: tRNA preQ1(34) S-adenosylmethionine ribosyltransferase-isomerase QueA [Spirochaetaceae bacterium]|nr:MAG: tRNA preQ1(34) S-adenosylmethionine ribosyltransferase-isomerase QueA [Spirochaetaceae bacterium]
METSSFFFDLPEELIAQTPADRRDHTRLMVCSFQADDEAEPVEHMRTADFAELVPANAVVVVNDSRVRKSRILARREHAGGSRECEVLFLSSDANGSVWDVILGRAGRHPENGVYHLPGGRSGTISSRNEQTFHMTLDRALEEPWFQEHGHVPLPPYIRRDDSFEDEERYQTVYAKEIGSAAAPTAGLHFTTDILDRMRSRGVQIAPVTLHVGIGTFAPIRTESIETHHMHEERYHISEDSARIINQAVKDSRPVVAIGTTSVRTLESAVDNTGFVCAGSAATSLYIYPGYEFRIVREMFTNFHTPGSSLVVMVSAFAGTGRIRRLYQTAIEKRYRFFSYGDAMYLRRRD